MLLDCQKSPDSTAIILYVLEYTGKDSAVVKYEFSADFMGGLRMLVKNDM